MEKDLYMDKELTSALYRAAGQWQLERERKAVAERLRKVVPSEHHGSHEMLSAICTAISEPVTGWTVGACQSLRDRLIALMSGDTDLAKTDAKMPDSGHVRECPQFPTATYDVLGNERHKVVCELRGISVDELCKKYDYIDIYPEFIWSIGRAIGLRHGAGFEEIINRLIHLLGADTILKEGGDGMARGDFERGTVPCDSVGARDVPEEAVVDECNFSTPESDTGMQDDGANPAETSNSHSDSVSFGTPSSITDELRKFAETFRYEWYDEKDGNVCYTTSDYPPSLDSVNMTDYICSIADRIDEQFSHICSQHESVLQQTISDTVDEHEQEMDELLDLIRDAAKDYQECQRLLRVFKCHTKDVRHERDELQDRLQAISVLCEQDDG